MFLRRPWLAVALLPFVAIGACADSPGGADPLAPDAALLASSGPVLVECPTSTSEATTGTLGTLGGSIALNGHELSLPLFAVLLPTEFRLEAPASRFVELDITANGADSFQFRKAVMVTIDYSRCTRSDIDNAELMVWQIDPVTKELLEPMGGHDDKIARTVTFITDHLSTYSLAR